jgi:mono/diheme cytochrome c family protein
VDRELPPSEIRLVGRALLVAGQLELRSAVGASRAARYATAVPPGPTAEYGEYLVRVGGCMGCHGPGLSGGRSPGEPETIPAATNITPAGIGTWTERDFFRAIREGKRPDGSAINPFMPWKAMATLSDDELRAIWLYLRSVPARETGTR